MAEKRLNIPAQMIQAGSRNHRSLLSLRENEGALDNRLPIYGEALGAPLSIAAVEKTSARTCHPAPISSNKAAFDYAFPKTGRHENAAAGTKGLLPLDLDVFFGAAIGDCDHDPNADRDHDADQGPRRADAGQDAQFPKRRQKATQQDDKSNEVHACPLHNLPPDELGLVKPKSNCSHKQCGSNRPVPVGTKTLSSE
jgi:hypothetical protein